MDIVSIHQVKNSLVIIVLFPNFVLIFCLNKFMKKFLIGFFLVILGSCTGNSNKLSTELFGIKIYDDIENYINISANEVAEIRSKNTLFLNTKKIIMIKLYDKNWGMFLNCFKRGVNYI